NEPEGNGNDRPSACTSQGAGVTGSRAFAMNRPSIPEEGSTPTWRSPASTNADPTPPAPAPRSSNVAPAPQPSHPPHARRTAHGTPGGRARKRSKSPATASNVTIVPRSYRAGAGPSCGLRNLQAHVDHDPQETTPDQDPERRDLGSQGHDHSDQDDQAVGPA